MNDKWILVLQYVARLARKMLLDFHSKQGDAKDTSRGDEASTGGKYPLSMNTIVAALRGETMAMVSDSVRNALEKDILVPCTTGRPYQTCRIRLASTSKSISINYLQVPGIRAPGAASNVQCKVAPRRISANWPFVRLCMGAGPSYPSGHEQEMRLDGACLPSFPAGARIRNQLLRG